MYFLGFGFTISEGHNGQKVKKILDLERCCALRQGDILLSINGIDLTTLLHHNVVETLKQCQIDTPTEFIIKRKKPRWNNGNTNGNSVSQLTQPKSSPLPMEEGGGMEQEQQISGIFQPMDTNVVDQRSALLEEQARQYQKSGLAPPLEVYYQQQQAAAAAAAAAYGKISAANGHAANYSEYILEAMTADDGQNGPIIYANDSATLPAGTIISSNEYANSPQYFPAYGSLQIGANGAQPIYESQYGEYAYQLTVPLKVPLNHTN